MSTFDIQQSAPGLLRAESVNITIRFERTGPSTGRVSWGIPTPAAGCTLDNQAYCGMLVTLDNKPATSDKIPKSGTVYSADPTAAGNLFAGDKLGSASIIGAFYNDRTTTFFDVTGLTPNTPYYVSGFPMDCQYRYFIEGVHAYSTEYTNRGSDGTSGTQIVVLNPNVTPMGVHPTDNTGLMPGIMYDFTMQLGLTPTSNRPVDSVECHLAAPKYTIDIDGTFAQTYEELVSAINRQLALLKNCSQGPLSPQTGAYYWNAQQKKLFQWDGTVHVEIPVIFQTAQPNVVPTGTYWLNSTTTILSQWNGSAWIVVTVLAFPTDPTLPIADKTYWFDSTDVYIWNGTTWCKLTSYDQVTDPSLAVEPPGGSYWYDVTAGILYKWNNALDMWNTTTAIQYGSDPNSLPTGTYWFDEMHSKLYAFNTPSSGWNEQTNIAISETAPATPAPGKFWYNPTTHDLFQRNLVNTAWVQVPVLVFPVDPTQRNFCDVWWDTLADILYVWDAIGLTWVQVTHFFEQATDPSLPPTLTEGTAWYDSATDKLYIWTNGCFLEVTFIQWPTNPVDTIPVGTSWHDTTHNTWFVMTLAGWQQITPVISANDPTSLPTGTFWFNSTTLGLSSWNGISWVSVTYSTTPLTPQIGACWFDTTTNMLKEWNGVVWMLSQPLAVVELDCNGNLLFTDTTVGSTSFINLIDGTLFQSLDANYVFHNNNPGTDGASDQPSYTELGIGTDGTDAIRNSILNDIRYELGYPVVTVELTKEQLDYAINKALTELRARASIAYKRGYFFMSIKANEQRFFLTNKISSMNKIVDVLGVYRLTSSFLSSAHGAGVYGQIVLQHMYNMGTFDLLSFHLQAEYSKLLEMLFAARVTYTWNEQTRELHLLHKFPLNEQMVCIEAAIERTEQDIMSDRYCKAWIRKYVGGTARIMLSEIRGKYSTLPGAGGSVTLNASDLRQAGNAMIEECLTDIDEYVVDKPDEWGNCTFTSG